MGSPPSQSSLVVHRKKDNTHNGFVRMHDKILFDKKDTSWGVLLLMYESSYNSSDNRHNDLSSPATNHADILR
jgi:hypothetical protein